MAQQLLFRDRVRNNIEMIPVDCLEEELMLDLFRLHFFQGELQSTPRASMDSLLDCFSGNSGSRSVEMLHPESNVSTDMRTTPTNSDSLTPPKVGLASALHNMCQTPSSPVLPHSPFSTHSPQKQRLWSLLEQYSAPGLPRIHRPKNTPLTRAPLAEATSDQQRGSDSCPIDRSHGSALDQNPPHNALYNPIWTSRAFSLLDQVRPIGSPSDRPEKDDQSFQRRDDSLPEEPRSS